MHPFDSWLEFYEYFFFFYFLVTQETGISEFLPGAVIDAALFEPCGYSANGLLDVSKK